MLWEDMSYKRSKLSFGTILILLVPNTKTTYTIRWLSKIRANLALPESSIPSTGLCIARPSISLSTTSRAATGLVLKPRQKKSAKVIERKLS